MHIVTIVGARPQFIKAATVSRALQQSAGVTEALVHTGQHYDVEMSQVFFQELDIPEPRYNLGIGSGSHGMQTGRILEAIEQVLLDERPDWVLVYGDTNSTLAGALAAAKLHVPIAHVEAGLRSFNRRMPEEINRVLTDHLATLLFAPTRTAVAWLEAEGISGDKVPLVGDVMFDAACYYAQRSESRGRILDTLRLRQGEYVLATIHRAENTDNDNRLRAIVEGLKRVAQTTPVVLPLHPRTRAVLGRHGWLGECKSLKLVPPVGYLEMVVLEKNACLIATDSGGMQKEAYFYRVPCITLRDETEWRELVDAGANTLCPPSCGEAIARAICAGMQNGFPPTAPSTLYGAGDAAQRIAAVLGQSDTGVARDSHA